MDEADEGHEAVDTAAPAVDLPEVEPVPSFGALVVDEPVQEESDAHPGWIPTADEMDSVSDKPAHPDLSAMPPPVIAPPAMAPPVVAEPDVPEPAVEAVVEAEEVPLADEQPDQPLPDLPPSVLSTMSPPERPKQDDLVLDPRALKALSRQERKDAKAAIRREQKEAREAARLAKAEAKASARAELKSDVDEAADLPVAAPAVTPEPEPSAPIAETPANMPPPSAPPAHSSGSDPRARAAARVQRRMGREAEKASAAEGRARAREELRRRRAQAKDLRSGTAAVEAVVRVSEESPDVTAEIPVVEDIDTQVIPPVAETPEIHDEIVVDEPVTEDSAEAEAEAEHEAEPDVEDVADESVDEEVAAASVELPDVAEEADEPESDEPVVDTLAVDEPVVDEPVLDEPETVSTAPVPEEMPAPIVAKPKAEKPARKWSPEPEDEPKDKRGLGPIAGIVGLVALAISVLLAVSALAVALGVDSGGVYDVLKALANALVGPLNHAFDFSGSNAERKEHFLAWGAGSLGYLVLSFVGQAVQRANSDDD